MTGWVWVKSSVIDSSSAEFEINFFFFTYWTVWLLNEVTGHSEFLLVETKILEINLMIKITV